MTSELDFARSPVNSVIMGETNQIFNRELLKIRRNRTAQRGADDTLKRELCLRLADRLEDVPRHFARALDLGCHGGQMVELLLGSPKIGELISCDLSPAMLEKARGMRVAASEEALPFAPQSFDLVMSAGSLHWVNDLPGALAQIRRILKPDGLFVAIMPGPASLQELRESFAAIESAQGVLRPHIAPFAEVRDAGNLLARAGFALPVADSDMLTLSYVTPLALLRELQAIGETNSLMTQEKGILPRSFFAQLCEYYAQHFALENGRVRASLELITLTGWAPHESQQRPARRGSGNVSLKDVLGG